MSTNINRKLYQEIASICGARHRCIASNNEFAKTHDETLAFLQDMLPSGSGIDCGTAIDKEASNDEKIVLRFSFHHMNDGGYYDGWTEHTAIITPSFSGFSIKITGRDRNDIKEYLHKTFHWALEQEVKREQTAAAA